MYYLWMWRWHHFILNNTTDYNMQTHKSDTQVWVGSCHQRGHIYMQSHKEENDKYKNNDLRSGG